MIDLWRGNANAWECDELGHMNVKFYLAKAMQAVANLAEVSGLRGIASIDAQATLVPTSIHIRFMSEARPGAPLAIKGGFYDVRDAKTGIILIMNHAGSGQIAATFRLDVMHARPGSYSPQAWPSHFSELADKLQVSVPNPALPRGLSEDYNEFDVSLERADQLELESIGMGRFTPDEMDVFGALNPESLLGRVSDSVVNFVGAFPEEWAYHKRDRTSVPRNTKIGSALLECRIIPHRWPQAGDGYVIRSGVKSFKSKIRNIVHWVLDPTTGDPWWTMEGVAAPMDLDARKLVDPDEQTAALLAAAVKSGLRA
jgi:acyl-CoA thioester hydrolase